jgi:hypothetical protein
VSLRPPSRYSASALSGGTGEGPFSPLDHEIAAEKAASLGRAGEKVERALRNLRDCPADATDRGERLREATQAVYAYSITTRFATSRSLPRCWRGSARRDPQGYSRDNLPLMARHTGQARWSRIETIAKCRGNPPAVASRQHICKER